MGTVYRKSITRPLPANATIATKRRRATAKELHRDPHRLTIEETVATWHDRGGKKRTGVVVVATDGSQRIRTSSETFYAKFRDGENIVREIPTGCRDIQAARGKLAELQRTAELVRVGSLTGRDLELGTHSKTPTATHIDAYVAHLRQEGRTAKHVHMTEKNLREVVAACRFDRLVDMNADAFLGWLATEQATGRSLSVLNSYIEAAVAFGYWLTGKRIRNRKSNMLGEIRIGSNPFAGIGKFDERDDQRRQRRALTEDELTRLLYVARWRPIAEYGRTVVSKTGEDRPADPHSRKTWSLKPLGYEDIQDAVDLARRKLEGNPGFLDELDRRGRERSLTYKLALLTGLRRGEIAALTLGHLDLDSRTPVLRMRPRDTKNRDAVDIPLRADLVEDLRQWLKTRRQAVGVVRLTETTKALDEPLFHVPTQLVKALDRDLAAAGIAKVDDRGRTIDIHALRHTFGSLLSRGGVAPRTAQAAMRHSDIALTMNTYVDPRLLDVAGAMDALPALPIPDHCVGTRREPMQATGTEAAASFVAPAVAPARYILSQKRSFSDTNQDDGTVATKTKKPLESQGKPRVFDSRGDRIRTYDPLVPNQMR
jgi:integrase